MITASLRKQSTYALQLLTTAKQLYIFSKDSTVTRVISRKTSVSKSYRSTTYDDDDDDPYNRAETALPLLITTSLRFQTISSLLYDYAAQALHDYSLPPLTRILDDRYDCYFCYY
jgi:hypothetical protein